MIFALIDVAEYVTLSLLFVAIGLFGMLAYKSKNVKSFQFQLSVFVLIWISGEILHTVVMPYLDTSYHVEEFSHVIHASSMILITLIFWMRYYVANRDRKRLYFVDDEE